MKKRILFVDDEPNILSGIRRMLHPLRNEYELRFAENAQRARELMAEEEADVIVSDMRMPGMDGAELLTIIQQEHPQAIRIMLTGQADDRSVLKTVTVAHQFLAKPCEPERLKEVLGRAALLHDQLTNGRIKELVTGIGSLPSLPSVYARLQETLKDPEASADDVAPIIEQDIGMTAKLLQLVNSSFFGLYQKVESPARAVKLLGLDTIKVLVLGIQIFAELKPGRSDASFAHLWEHSITVAQCAKKIALSASDDLDLINNAYIGGMLHDVGRLLLLSLLGKEYDEIVETARQNRTRLEHEENLQLQATHADIGAYLIGLWGFNAEIIQAVAFHHDLQRLPGRTFSAALAIHVANVFYYEQFPENAVGSPPPLQITYLESLGIAASLDSWRQSCQSILERSNDE